ncbi:MAG: hypothetical protein Q8Q42_00105 [Nanoarchaeota archaeon]|nr:hypothetical protein [Nanoarchaeota archaeon]
MKKIVLDTSFILTALSFKIDLKSELSNLLDEPFSIYYVDKSREELKNKPLEKLALAILKNLGAVEIKTSQDKNVDSLLISHAESNPNDIIATQDKALKEKLKKRKARLITIRQKRYLKMVN